MVEDVRKDHRELECDALVDLDVLFNAHVHVPVGCAVDGTDARILGVDAKDWCADLVTNRHWILEHVDRSGSNAGSGHLRSDTGLRMRRTPATL